MGKAEKLTKHFTRLYAVWNVAREYQKFSGHRPAKTEHKPQSHATDSSGW